VEDVIGDYQCGFRQGRSTIDQIFNLHQVLEKCNEFGIETHLLFTDFRAAYDSIDRSNLGSAMKEFQIPRKFTALVKATMSNTLCQIRIQNLLSDPIHTKNGVRQGDALACLLFNTALEKVIRDSGINLITSFMSVQILSYADDIDIIGRTQKAMKEAFANLKKAARKMHLQINQGKTKYMPVTKQICSDGPTYLEITPYNLELFIVLHTWDQRSTTKMISVSTSKNISYQQTDVSMGLENI
jgi:sorting nexin-29